MFVLLFQLLSTIFAYPLLESGQILIGTGGISCEKETFLHTNFLNIYKAYQPQVIFTMNNYTNELQFSDFALDIHLELVDVNTTGFTIQIICTKSCIKSVLYTWYAFGGDTYDSGCFPLQQKATVTLEQIYTSPMQHVVFIAGFAGFFKYGGKKPMLKLSSKFDNQNLSIQTESTFQSVYICYLLAQDLSSATLNDTEIATLVQKGTYMDDSLLIGIESFQSYANNLQIQMLNDKSFFPKQLDITIKVAKLYEPTYRICPKVYTECMFQGDPIYVCDETVKLTMIWKEFKSLRVYDQKMKFKLNIANNDNILWISEDIDCSYDMYDQLMEAKIKNQPIEKQIIRKRKMIGMLYDNEDEENNVEYSEDTVLVGQL